MSKVIPTDLLLIDGATPQSTRADQAEDDRQKYQPVDYPSHHDKEKRQEEVLMHI